MSMSASATLAWGVNLAQGEYGEVDSDVDAAIGALQEHDWDLAKFFGFTEEAPSFPAHTRDLERQKREAHPDYVAYRRDHDAWGERKLAAIPVDFDYYGSYDYGGKVLYVKRTYTSVNWGCDVVDPLRPGAPGPHEMRALNKVLDAIGFKGNRTPQLLLYAMYG